MPDNGWKCRCGCGCNKTHFNGTSDYCNRCAVGDCPNPDEDIPEECPVCSKPSNLATIEEFGWCLRPTCQRPRWIRPGY